MTPAEILQLTNEYRAKQGLPPLKLNPQLMQAAQNRAQDMVTTGSFSHTVATTSPGVDNWSFIKKSGYGYQAAGENLARNFDNANDTFQGWVNSPSHKANLVKDYQDTGIGIAYDKSNKPYVVQFFGTPLKTQPAPQPQAPTPTPPAPAPQPPKRFSLDIPMDTKTANSTPQTLGNTQPKSSPFGVIIKP